MYIYIYIYIFFFSPTAKRWGLQPLTTGAGSGAGSGGFRSRFRRVPERVAEQVLEPVSHVLYTTRLSHCMGGKAASVRAGRARGVND